MTSQKESLIYKDFQQPVYAEKDGTILELNRPSADWIVSGIPKHQQRRHVYHAIEFVGAVRVNYELDRVGVAFKSLWRQQQLCYASLTGSDLQSSFPGLKSSNEYSCLCR